MSSILDGSFEQDRPGHSGGQAMAAKREREAWAADPGTTGFDDHAGLLGLEQASLADPGEPGLTEFPGPTGGRDQAAGQGGAAPGAAGQDQAAPEYPHSARLMARCASALLRYPDRELLEAADDVESIMGDLPPGHAAALEHLLDHLQATPLPRLQEEHARAFDLDAKASPHLSWHRYGDDPKRGRALAGLNELYRDAGFEVLPGELPDYLPLVLEFLSACPPWAADCLLDGFAASMRQVAGRLGEMHSPYAPLLAATLEAFGAAPGAKEES